MLEDLPGPEQLVFYSTSAQILPVLLLAVGLQLRGFGLGTAPRRIKLQLPLQLPGESPEQYFSRIGPAVAVADAWMGRSRVIVALVCLSSVVVAEPIAVSVLTYGHAFTGARAVILVAGRRLLRCSH